MAMTETKKMVTITIDGISNQVSEGTLVIEAARQIGVMIPHFCYHPKLGYDANCRMCHVEIEKSPKLQASCSIPVTDGMVVLFGFDQRNGYVVVIEDVVGAFCLASRD